MSELTATSAAPWREMGLTDAEYEKIQSLMGRAPNWTELGMFAVLWSEHCSYKHSKKALRQFPTTGSRVLVGPGENAGVVEIDPAWDHAVAFRIESHNHPCAIEPYQGAATGVGGILRDILAMGARPIALLDSLRFGNPSDPKVRYLFSGVVSGIAGYGNCVGVPTVGGEVLFEDTYRENPLCNVMCVGVVEKERLTRGVAAGVGNAVLLVGAFTGRDGIHGATFASGELNEESEAKRPAVQVGDPFMEKLLIEACLELIQKGRVVGIQDMGAAGLTSSLAETAGRGGSGVEIDVGKVPLREPSMTPYEIMLSESQERMLVIVERGGEQAVQEICARWGLNCVEIGQVTDDGFFRVKEAGKVVAEIPVEALTEHAPVCDPPSKRPVYLDETRHLDLADVPLPEEPAKALLALLGSPAIASKEWIYSQYDHQVRTNTVVVPGAADAAVLRLGGTKRGIAVATDANGRYCYLNPKLGGAIAVAEAARNVSCTGAEPVAITNCLNFGNPEKPEVFWQIDQAIAGMSEACRALGTPVTGGNVSLYNESAGADGPVAVYPTPVVGMLGILENVEARCTMGFAREGDAVALIGESLEELGGSEYLKWIHGMIKGEPPSLDLERERRVQQLCREAVQAGLLHSAHDCSDGGLAVAMAESCIVGKIGAQLSIPAATSQQEPIRWDAALFGESQSRILVSLDPNNVEQLQSLAARYEVPISILGTTGGHQMSLEVQPILHAGPGAVTGVSHEPIHIELSVAEISNAWQNGLARLMERGDRAEYGPQSAAPEKGVRR